MNGCAICGKQLVSTTDICLTCVKREREREWYEFLDWLMMVQNAHNRDRFYEIWEPGKIQDVDQELHTYRENHSYDVDVWNMEEDFQWYWAKRNLLQSNK